MKDAGVLRAAKIVGDDAQAHARGRVGIARIERQNDRCLRAGEHVDREVLRERALDKWHKLFCQMAQDDARIVGRIDVRQFVNEGRNLEVPRLHGRREQRVFAGKVAQHRGRRDVQLGCNIGERRRFEAFAREDAPCRFQQLLASNDGRPSHL